MVVTVVRTKNACFADTIQVTGVLAPRSEILVRPDRDGLQISQVLVEVGDSVVSGQVLARLTPLEGSIGQRLGHRACRGVISARNAVVGTMASTRADPLFRIATNEEMELLAEAPIKTLARLAPNPSADRYHRRRGIERQGPPSLDRDQSDHAAWPSPDLRWP